MDNKYTSFELMKMFNIKKGSWNNLKKSLNLDIYAEKIIENNKPKFLYNRQAYEILKDRYSACFIDIEFKGNSENSVAIQYQQVIDVYKQENEYLKQQLDFSRQENQRLLDIITMDKQKEIAQSVQFINTTANTENIVQHSFWSKLFGKFKK